MEKSHNLKFVNSLINEGTLSAIDEQLSVCYRKTNTIFVNYLRAIVVFLILTPSSMSNYICWIVSFPSRQSSAQGTSSNKSIKSKRHFSMFPFFSFVLFCSMQLKIFRFVSTNDWCQPPVEHKIESAREKEREGEKNLKTKKTEEEIYRQSSHHL